MVRTRLSDVLSGVIRDYTEKEITIGRDRYEVRTLTADEVEKLVELLDYLYFRSANESVKQIIQDNIQNFIDIIRLVKVRVNANFKGVDAKGNDLTAIDLKPEAFASVWGAAPGTNWRNSVTAGTSYDYIGTSTSPISVKEEEGYVIVGLMDLSPVPKIGKLQVTKNGQDELPIDLKWESIDEFNVCELPYALIFPPESTFYIRVKAYETGVTELIPIGLKVVQAKTISKI